MKKYIMKPIKAVWAFPNKINALTILVVLVVYTLGLVLMARVISPELDYVVELNYEAGVYHSEINPYIFVRGTAIDTDTTDDETTLRPQYRVIAQINTISSAEKTNIRYAYSGLDADGMMKFFYESNRIGSNNLPVIHYVVASAEFVGGDDFQKYFIKVKYDVVEGTETITKELTLSEQVLHLSKRELDDAKFTANSAITDVLNVEFSFSDQGSSSAQYNSNVAIDFNVTTPYHVNMQSWIVTTEGKILPYLGLYNYCTPKDFEPYYETAVYKYVKPEFIYVKLEYRDEQGIVTPLYYKASVTELLGE
jgi:hypothetical protein